MTTDIDIKLHFVQTYFSLYFPFPWADIEIFPVEVGPIVNLL